MPNKFQQYLDEYADRAYYERMTGGHRCPSKVQDLYEAARWWAEQARAWDHDPDRIAVADAAWDCAEWARERLTVGGPADRGAITRKRNKARAALDNFAATHPEGANYLAAISQTVETLTAAREALELAAIAFACEPSATTGMALEQAFRVLADAERDTDATQGGHDTDADTHARGLVAEAKAYRQALGAEVWADIEATEGTAAHREKVRRLRDDIEFRARGIERLREELREEEAKHAAARDALAAFLSQVEQRKGLAPEAADTMAALTLLGV